MVLSMNSKELTQILQHQIPLSKAMGIQVRRVSVRGGVHFFLPLAPNRNHKNTAFGGTLVAAQALAAWSWLMALLEYYQLNGEVVVQRLKSEFARPVDSDFRVATLPVSKTDVQKFIATLKKKRRARMAIRTQVRVGRKKAVEYCGEYVAMLAK